MVYLSMAYFKGKNPHRWSCRRRKYLFLCMFPPKIDIEHRVNEHVFTVRKHDSRIFCSLYHIWYHRKINVMTVRIYVLNVFVLSKNDKQ